MPKRLEAVTRLSLVSGVGPRTIQTLMQRFQSAEAVLRAPCEELRCVDGVGGKLAERIASASRTVDVRKEWELCCRHGITLTTRDQPHYPRLLKEIHDPPSILYSLGGWQSADNLSIAVVGTRHASRYGQQQAERLACGLAVAGLTVVSGLARGIDAAAHRGALAAGGRTLAVLGSGLLRIYPPEHKDLAGQIAGSGGVFSELPPRRKPTGGAFPQRNRIISGLSMGIVVVEAPPMSGALVTARHALEQGREVFAVPGRVDNRNSRGCHQLIRDGAKLVETVEDILDELGPVVEQTTARDGRLVRHPAELQLGKQERLVLDAISVEPTSIEQVISETGLPVHRTLSTISVLEMKHLVGRLSGHLVVRK